VPTAALRHATHHDQQVQERRATRGLAASARLQGQYRAAIAHLERVLDISREMGEFTGTGGAASSGVAVAVAWSGLGHMYICLRALPAGWLGGMSCNGCMHSVHTTPPPHTPHR
jgi:hypothetical protein